MSKEKIMYMLLQFGECNGVEYAFKVQILTAGPPLLDLIIFMLLNSVINCSLSAVCGTFT